MSCRTAEEFKYFVLNTPRKWREGFGDSVILDRDGRLSLTPMLNLNQLGDIGHATGLGIDRKGDLYIINARDCQIHKFLSGSRTVERLECFDRCAIRHKRFTCHDDLRRRWQARGLFGCGSEEGEFKFAEGGDFSGGLAFAKATMYVADSFNHRVQAFYLPGFQISLILGKRHRHRPVSGAGEGEFNSPKDVVTDSKGNLYVLDYGNNRIQQFNRSGGFLRFIGTGVLKKPESLAIDGADFIYVVDSVKSTVEKFNRQGEWQGTPVKFRPSFMVTEQFLTDLKSEGVPENVLVKLRSIKKRIIGEENFEEGFKALLKAKIGEEQTVKFGSVILKHAVTRLTQPSAVAVGSDRASFIITEQFLTDLKSEGVPEKVLVKLRSIKKRIIGEENIEESFKALLKARIGEEQTCKFEAVILKHAVARLTQPSAVAAGGDRIIYVGERGEGGDLSISQFDDGGRHIGRFGGYSGGCFKLVTDRKGRLYGSCGADGQVILFGGEGNFEKQGRYFSRVFDSTIDRCEWHRLALELQPTERANLNVFFHASDRKVGREEIEANDGWVHLLSAPHNSIAVQDALFRNGVGRYLQLKFEFFGDGFNTYRVGQARIFFQRNSYLRYLPSVYQEDEAGRDFLERFMSIFESMSFEVEQEIAGMARYFDPEAVNGEFLEWLGTWLAALRDNNWPEEKRREFLTKAFQLYKLRGTARGLQETIELFAGGETAVIEHYRLKSPMVLGAQSALGDSTVVGRSFTRRLVLEESSRIGEFALIEDDEPPEKPWEANAFDFTILADTSRLEGQDQLRALQRLVEGEKPAHTRCFLRTSEGEMQLGAHALLQIDTKLSKGFAPARLGVTSQLGERTFLGTKLRRRGTIGARSAISLDAVLH
ncbi:MAG: phage tail protein [Blastocatellia bacterium]